MKRKLFWVSWLAIGVAACSVAQTAIPLEVPTQEEAVVTVQAPVPAEDPDPLPGVTPTTAPEDGSPKEPDEQPTEIVIEPIEVTYFTPAQGEGPYYTVNKPEDRDNDLTVVEGAGAQPAGEIIEFSGKVYAASGMPLEGAIVEIWQTDNSGVYLHPDDPATGERDPNFQFYGEASTGTDGGYWFRTILPGKYEPRPIHIHFKVLVDQQVILTSQFYFEGDPSLESDRLFLGAGGGSENLIITLSDGNDTAGNPILIGERDIILDI